MSITSLKDALEKRNRQCPTCNEKHDPKGKCKRGDLVFRIENLIKANSLIPQLMNAAKEATETAASFQKIVKQADEAHSILMKVLSDKGPLGELICKEYLEELDKWVKESTSQDTSEKTNPSSQENSMSQEMPISDSTNPPNGLVFVEDSLQSTRNVIAAERGPKLSTTLNQAKDV